MANIDQNAITASYNQANPPVPTDAITADYLKAQANPTPTTSAPGEIATGALRGVLSGVPESLGMGMQAVGMDTVGGALRHAGEYMGQQPWLQAHPEGHGGMVNNLTGAAEGMGRFAIPAAMESNPFTAPFGALALGAQMAGEGYTQEKEAAQAKGVNPQEANDAALLNAASNFAWGYAGGKIMKSAAGATAAPFAKMLGTEGPATAAGILDQLAGTQPLLKTFGKQLPLMAGEGMGVMLGQAGTNAAINNAYGVDDTSPLDAMKEQIGPSLAMTALASPMALVSRGLFARSARDRTAKLASGDTAPGTREQLANQYAAELSKVDPQKAAQFSANAKNAIETGQGMPVDSRMFDPSFIEGLPRTAAGQGQGDMFGGTPEASPFPSPPQPAQGDMFGTPPDLQPQEQPVVDPNQGDLFTPEAPQEPTGTQQGIRFPTPESDAAALAEAQQHINPGEGLSTQELINRNTGVNTPAPDVSTRDARALDADAAFAKVGEPSGVVGGGASVRGTEPETPQAPQREPNATKPQDAITSDVNAVRDAHPDVNAQTKAAFTRTVNGIEGLADAPTHQDQIDLLERAIDKAKGDKVQLMQKLLDSWKSAMPAKEGEPAYGSPLMWRNQDTDIPVTFSKVMGKGSDGVPYAEVHYNGKASYAPMDQLFRTQDGKPTDPLAETIRSHSGYGTVLPMPTDPVARAKVGEYFDLLKKLQTQGHTPEERDRMDAIDPWHPSPEAQQKAADEAGVPIETVQKYKGLYKPTGYQEGTFDIAGLQGLHKVDQAVGELHRAYGDSTRANAAESRIKDEQLQAGTYSHDAYADALRAEAERVRTDANTPGTFEHGIQAKQEEARRAELNDRYQRVLRGWVSESLQELSRLRDEGHMTPEEQARVTEALHNAHSYEDAIDILDDAGMRAQDRKKLLKKLKALPAANDMEKQPAAAAREQEGLANNVSSPEAGRAQPAAAGRAQEGLADNLNSPETRGQPVAAERAQEELAGNVSNPDWAPRDNRSPERQRADAALGRLQTLVTGFRDRENAGETLSKRDMARDSFAQEHYDKLVGMFNKLENTGKLDKLSEEDWKTIENHISALERGPSGPRALNRAGGLLTEAPYQPSVAAQIERSNKLSDMLSHLAENGTTAGVRALAKVLGKLGLDTTIHPAWIPTEPGRQQATLGRYSPTLNRIEINNGHASETTVLHEAVHAALYKMIEGIQKIGKPANQREAQMKRALGDLESIRQKAAETTSGKLPYGLVNIQEFVAELKSNPRFQDFLKGQRADGSSRTLWSRVVDAVRRMFGMPVDHTSALEHAMSATDALLDARRDQNEFNASPEGAAAVADRNVESLAKLADTWGEGKPINLNALREDVFKKLLGWKTVDFIAHGMDVLPVMRQSGFSAALNAYRTARDSRRVVSEHISGALGDYVDRLQKTLGKTGASRELQMKMQAIGGEASIHGFSYRMNFADNNRPTEQGGGGRNLDPSLASKVNDVYRQYTQLKQAHPELAKLLVEGEQHNRKTLTMTAATIARDTMSALTGQVPRLEAELARLPADDANRARVADQLTNARAEAQFANEHMNGLDFMRPDLQTARNGAAGTHLDGASYELSRRLISAFKASRNLPEGSLLRRNLGLLDKQYYVQSQNPYFSLGRDGDYFVNIKFKEGTKIDAQTLARLNAALKGTNKVIGDLDGETHAFFRVETSDQAEGLFKKLVAAGGNAVIDTPGSAKGLLADYDMKSASGVTDALRQLQESLHGMVDNDKSLTPEQALGVKQTLTRQLLSMLPETSARSAKMDRRGIPGYDGDFVRNFARRAGGTVQDLSNQYTNRQFSASLKGMKDSIEGMNKGGAGATMRDATRAQMVADEINKRYTNSMTPMDNSVVNLINSLGHSFFLAASPAFYIRTAAQPYHRGVPYVGSRYGMVNAAKEMAAATPIAMKVISSTIARGWNEGKMRGVLDSGLKLDDLNLNPADRHFLQEMADRGELKLGLAQQLQHATSGDTQLKQDVARFASMFAQYAEMTNRIVVGLAAFRLAEKGAKNVTQAGREANIDYGQKAIRWTMDNFDADNTARQIGKYSDFGKLTPLASSFMNYDLQTMQHIARTVGDGLFGQDKSPAGLQRAKEAKKEFAGLMLTTAMISGLRGLPFVAAFAGVYNMLTKDQDDPTDVRDTINTTLTKTLGTGVGNTIAHGLPYAFNMDTSTFGLQNLLPGSEFLADRRQWADRIESQSQQLMGPALNAGIDIALGMNKIHEGNVVKGVEQMLPSGLKSYYKAAELAGVIGPGGYTDSKGDPMPVNEIKKPNGWDILRQGLGFRSAEKADVDDARYSFQVNQQGLEHRRQVIGEQTFKATTGSPAQQQAAMEAIQRFNTANPTQPILGVMDAMRQRAVKYGVGADTGLGFGLTGRQAAVAMGQVGYAAMPRGQ